MGTETVSISLYQNSVPEFAELEMERLYQHMYASISHLKAYGNMADNTSTYVARKNGEVTVVLLFRLEQNRIRVLNEQIRISQEEIDRFTQFVFGHFKTVNVVSFPVVDTKVGDFSYPHQQFHCTQDIVLTLPGSGQAYFDSLGKATRTYIKRYLNKLRRDFPSVSCNTYLKDEAGEQHIRDIIRLNRARMAGKHKASYIDDAETERIIKLVRQCGLVTVMTINGRVCAGAINYRFGGNYFLKVVGHDPSYDDYGLGTLCCYLSICECIGNSGKEYHFLWGQYEYKYRLLGIQRDLDHFAAYRSRVQLLRNSGIALKIAFTGWVYQVRSWALNKARRKDNSSFGARLVFYVLNDMKRLKRYASR